MTDVRDDMADVYIKLEKCMKENEQLRSSVGRLVTSLEDRVSQLEDRLRSTARALKHVHGELDPKHVFCLACMALGDLEKEKCTQ